jgi:hypothetical protein
LWLKRRIASSKKRKPVTAKGLLKPGEQWRQDLYDLGKVTSLSSCHFSDAAPKGLEGRILVPSNTKEMINV